MSGSEPYKPGKSDVYTFMDCVDRTTLIEAYPDKLVETSEDCCGNENAPFVIFPRNTGFKDPLYCRVARGLGICPKGFR